MEEVLRVFLSFPLPLSPVLAIHFPLVWPSLAATLVKPFWLSFGAIPPHHSGGIHLGYVINVTLRACEIANPSVSVEPSVAVSLASGSLFLSVQASVFAA